MASCCMDPELMWRIMSDRNLICGPLGLQHVVAFLDKFAAVLRPYVVEEMTQILAAKRRDDRECFHWVETAVCGNAV